MDIFFFFNLKTKWTDDNSGLHRAVKASETAFRPSRGRYNPQASQDGGETGFTVRFYRVLSKVSLAVVREEAVDGTHWSVSAFY